MRQAQRSTTPWRKAQYLLYKQSRDSPTKWTVKTNTYSLFASATVPPVLIRDGPRIRTITPNAPRASSLFSPAQAGIYALGKAFMRSAPCLGGFHSVAFEKVSMLLFSLSFSLSLSLSNNYFNGCFVFLSFDGSETLIRININRVFSVSG